MLRVTRRFRETLWYTNWPATPRGQGFEVRGTLKQSAVPEHFLARVPLYATGPAGKPVFLGAVITDAAETPFRFTARINPKRVVIDPNQTLLWREK